MDCVVCSRPLEPVDHEGVTLDRCPDGHGVWLDRDELRLVVESQQSPRPAAERANALAGAGPASAAQESAPGRPCPACRTPMERVRYDETSDIEIENCLEHGVWMDAGELERAEAWLEANRELTAGTRQRMAQEVAENNAELDAAYAAGERFGPFRTFVAMLHYARHSADPTSDQWGADRARAEDTA